ncbi:hypothetical protein DD238_008182 [Peronospora effusa]|uniref:Transmembrane protein n=1 Tax=Peronospora effusa TaxID=542832 RepID=A0A3M6V729_9STRA|nr:hypothetical protein DD238_008182 [Peronospora effusa]RQM14839.1 hypothetical protein DD237_003301 [Peronospora effusa]
MTKEDSWFNNAVQRLRHHFSSDRSVSVYEALTAHVLDAATGGALFLSGVSAAQVAQNLLRIGSASGFLLPQAFGAAAVASSSVLALHFAFIPREIYQELAAQSRRANEKRRWSWLVLGAKNLQPPKAWKQVQLKVQERYENLSQAPYPVYMVMGLLCFKLLGGRMSALAPSPFANLGAFHLKKASLPATVDYATSIERGIIQEFGRLFGCHTCGVKRGVRYHADHMPPKLYAAADSVLSLLCALVLTSTALLMCRVAKRTDEKIVRRMLGRKTTFRFYPQCESCSNRQGSVVKQWKSTLKMHLLSFRAYHFTGLWLVLLCTGGLYVGGSSFHETSEVSAPMDAANETPNSFASSDFALLMSLRERERKLRRERGKERESIQVAKIDKELEAVAECTMAVKADIKRQKAN